MRKKRKASTIRDNLTYKAKAKKKKPLKPRVDRTHNAATMTEAMFFQFIRQALRNKTRFWKPILETKKEARRPYSGPGKRQKWEYRCSVCGDYFSDGEVQVHHIHPAGSLNCYADLPGFVQRLFCEREGLILVCAHCHEEEHQKLSA